LFEHVDAHLHRGRTLYAMRYVESGLNVAFDAKSRAQYHSASSSDAEFEKFLQRLSAIDAMETNMDW
jgi:hypothetical protein